MKEEPYFTKAEKGVVGLVVFLIIIIVFVVLAVIATGLYLAVHNWG